MLQEGNYQILTSFDRTLQEVCVSLWFPDNTQASG